jgi:hypothetical protein
MDSSDEQKENAEFPITERLDSLSNETFNKLGHKKKKFLEIF